jgi:hypothetical protein
VEEPATHPNNPSGLWRLYYINSSTGLLDKVVSQERGRPITAEFSRWVDQGGEIFPTQITWKQNKETVMEMTIINISHGPKQ